VTYRWGGRCDSVSTAEVIFVVVVVVVIIVVVVANVFVDIGSLPVFVSVLLSVLVLIVALFAGFARWWRCYWWFILEKLLFISKVIID
jgi:hypothetical protein